ncbi:MAG: molybdopterin-guanine dinucleotide biosynthesis protein B [Hyphomicrobiales bacterium]|nr:molybdopterin-guanine dinucleotide biosynthesis protein B [Hyphomicrobiales bacterium]
MRVIGFAGWSGAGKTTLISRLIPELTRRGVSVSTIKHSHHATDPEANGKDTSRHRAAGARETLLGSPQRLSLVRELRRDGEPPLAALLDMLAPVDLVLVEGYKRAPFLKIEVFRAGNGKPPLWPDDPQIVALVSDGGDGPAHLPFAHIDDIAAVASIALALAPSFEATLQSLEG